MAIGKVKWFNTRKGYGFIETAEGLEVFVHYSEIKANGCKTLVEGQSVRFEVVSGTKGFNAHHVIVEEDKVSI